MPDSSFALRSPMPASADDVYAWHARPGAFQRLQPPWERFVTLPWRGAFGTDGLQVEFRTHSLGPIQRTWVVEVFDFEPGRGFKYRQIDGPFADWLHIHRFVPNGEGRSFLENDIRYRLPLGQFGRALTTRMVRRRLDAMFAYRHAITASDLRRHGMYRDRPRLKVAITGSRGLVGSELVTFLTTGGHSVVRLVTGTAWGPTDDGTKYVAWNPQAPLAPAAIAGCDAVVHLAGDGIADGRWTDAKRKSILDSRTIPTRHVAEAIAALPDSQRPRVLVSGSAVGIYGDRGDDVLTEDSPTGTGFLADVCREWEEATAPAATADVRVVSLRTGVVQSPKGGALGKPLPAFRAGAGAVLGSGKQWVPWIAANDLVGAIHHCMMTDAVQGPVNAVAPNPATNRDYTMALGRALSRPAALRLPREVLRVMFGDIADAALLASLRAVPKKLLDTGFTFDHCEVDAALRFLLGKAGDQPHP